MDSQAVIEKWNERYRQRHDDLQIPLPFFVEAMATLRPGLALDLACGLGRHSIWLAEHGWRVIAIDGSSVAVASLQGTHPNLDARLADIEAPGFEFPDGPYDLVVDTFFLYRPLFPLIWDALKAGGFAVMAFHLTGTFAIQAHEIDGLVENYEVLHRLVHTDIPTVELVLRKTAKS